MTDNEITYKDCIWYMDDLDRCKLPGLGERYMKCASKECMNDFCTWVTDFLKPKPKIYAYEEEQLNLFDNIKDEFSIGSSLDLAPESYMNKLLEQAYKKIIADQDDK